MAYDPVCRVEVDERTPWSSAYQGKTYYFNSAECKADFDKDPARYSAAQQQGAAAEAGLDLQHTAGQMKSRARSKLTSVIGSQKDKAADRIGAVSVALKTASQRLREQNQEAFAQYADKIAAQIDDLSGYLQTNEPDQIINEAEDFIRRRPGFVIGGAFAAGFFMARFLKSSRSVAA